MGHAGQPQTEPDHQKLNRFAWGCYWGVIGGETAQEGGTVYFIAATNTPGDLDEAVLRRLERKFYIPLPDAPARSGYTPCTSPPSPDLICISRFLTSY